MVLKKKRLTNTLFLKSREKNLLIEQVYVDHIIFGAMTNFLYDEFTKLSWEVNLK